jgi:hypothetical protein
VVKYKQGINMRRDKLDGAIMDRMSSQMQDNDLGDQARKEGTHAFTREGEMGCAKLVLLILRGIHSQLQNAIDMIYEQLEAGVSVTRQAVSKARANLEPGFIRRMVHEAVEMISGCEDLVLYKGKYRLCAIDGSGVSLRKALALAFGTSNGKATALGSLAYDPLNDVVMDASLNRYGSGERIAAQANIETCEKLS